ncbi:MAG: glycosyltransferase [Opitutaceae bacterium]
MKIAFVSTILGYPWGGADALWTAAAEAAAERGDRLHLEISNLVAPDPRVRALIGRGAAIGIRRAPESTLSVWARGRSKAGRWLGQTDPLLRRLRAFAPDLAVFSCGGTYDTVLETPVCEWLRASGTRYRIIANLQHEHPRLPEADRRRAREILIAADRLFFVSPRNLAITRRHLLHPLPNAECIHGCRVHNPLAPERPPAWADPPPWTFATVARLESIKGIDLVIAALAAGLGAEADWRLNVHGRGPDLGYLEECAVHFGLEGRVRFRGFAPSIDAIWSESHLLISAALDEGVPMTLPEAMFRSRAVLATRVGAADEWIDHGRTGFLCPAPNLELLTASLREAWAGRERWREMGMAAAERARALHRPNDYLRILSP